MLSVPLAVCSIDTKSIDQSPTSEDNSRVAGQILSILWNLYVHCRVYKRLPLDRIVSQINPAYTFAPYLFFNITQK
jgi:hypothetical protein